jgi:hypothetical protein
MNLAKTPHQILLEKAGLSLDPSPGLVNTPQQMLLQQANALPQYAPGGAVRQNLSPADMQAAMIIQGHTPQKFASGGQAAQSKHVTQLRDEMNRNLLKIKHSPLSALWNALNFFDVGAEGYEAAKNASQGKAVPATEHAFKSLSGIPAAMPSVPMAVSLGVPVAGQQLADYATEHMAQNPQFRQQMLDVTSSPLGGALSGDAGLAANIMGNLDYSQALQDRLPQEQTPAEQPVQQRRVSPLYQKTMVK